MKSSYKSFLTLFIKDTENSQVISTPIERQRSAATTVLNHEKKLLDDWMLDNGLKSLQIYLTVRTNATNSINDWARIGRPSVITPRKDRYTIDQSDYPSFEFVIVKKVCSVSTVNTGVISSGGISSSKMKVNIAFPTHVWRRRGERNTDACIMERNSLDGPNIMIWN